MDALFSPAVLRQFTLRGNRDREARVMVFNTEAYAKCAGSGRNCRKVALCGGARARAFSRLASLKVLLESRNQTERMIISPPSD